VTIDLKNLEWKTVKCPCGDAVCKSYFITPNAFRANGLMDQDEAQLASAAPDLARAAQKFLRARGTVDHVVRQRLMDAVHQDIEAALHKALNIKEPTDEA
jgi:hypothetical protein